MRPRSFAIEPIKESWGRDHVGSMLDRRVAFKVFNKGQRAKSSNHLQPNLRPYLKERKLYRSNSWCGQELSLQPQPQVMGSERQSRGSPSRQKAPRCMGGASRPHNSDRWLPHWLPAFTWLLLTPTQKSLTLWGVSGKHRCFPKSYSLKIQPNSSQVYCQTFWRSARVPLEKLKPSWFIPSTF